MNTHPKNTHKHADTKYTNTAVKRLLKKENGNQRKTKSGYFKLRNEKLKTIERAKQNEWPEELSSEVK